MTPTNDGRNGEVVLADRYRLEDQVATGGMGEVWRATDLLLERTVAVKLLRESLAEDPILSERFRREALMAARLSHPNMADVYDYVQEGDRTGIVMEYVDGETLSARIGREGALDVTESVRIASALLAVLQTAHDAGIVHRDVKPGNVMISPTGAVKVTDFGIARAAGHETLTETGMVVGTAHYLSPEQVTGHPATPSSDIYAAGTILYEMLTGEKSFAAETPLAIAMRRLNEDPTPIREVRHEIPESVAQVTQRALQREPGRRYDSADGMRSALEAALEAAVAPTPSHGMDPTRTEVMPVIEAHDAPTQIFGAQTTTPATTGKSPAAKVSARRRRDYRRGALWLIVVAVIVGLGTVGILALSGNGPVRVPSFKGMQISDARALAGQLGLEVIRTDRPSGEPEGEVLSQNIAPGVRVASGGQVTLIVSTGTPPCCRVPLLLGLSKGEAEDALKAFGLELGDVSELTTEEFDEGTVIGQEPDAEETKPQGTEVDIVVAKNPDRGKGKGNND
ncbi:MAG: Stk1 family PASTA domain-containing Ser/Thr kinase [Actinomycetota bacterium]